MEDRETIAQSDAHLDARGLLCPLPVLKLRKRLAPLSSGQVITVVTDDPAALVDVPHFCAEQGHALLNREISDQICTFIIKKS